MAAPGSEPTAGANAAPGATAGAKATLGTKADAKAAPADAKT
ncbi:hypothetical protein GA0115246_105631, partial [Streptomyces sp. SolWspMP-sol7th]